MSKESVQFIEMIREAAARRKEEQRYHKMFCQGCCQERAHWFLGEFGIFEKYQCIFCGLIRSVAVR